MTGTPGCGPERAFAKALAFPVLLVIGFAGDARSQGSPAGDRDRGSYRLSVNVDLLVLHATVRDPKGRFTSDLSERDFEVYEDGVRQSIRLFRHEDVPVAVGLVVDHSGSMRRKLTDVIAAARTFVRSSNQEDQMFVVNFNENVTLGLPGAIRFTDRLAELESAILKAPATGQTALCDAVVEAQERVQSGRRGKKDPDSNPDALRRLARATGGEAFFPGQLNEVVAICERIARDIRHQYTIGYVSSNAAPSGYWAIRAVARTAGNRRLFVRTRSGYIAARESRVVKDEAAK